MGQVQSRRLSAKERRRRRRRLLWIRRIIVLIILVLFLFIVGSIFRIGKKILEDSKIQGSSGNMAAVSRDVFPDMREILGNRDSQEEQIRNILADEQTYPQELREMLSKNEETLDFVLGYPEKKNSPCADTVGEVEQGTIPLLMQWDERWGYAQYGDGLLAYTGCGPTCLSMVAVGLTGDRTITPYRVASYAQENGYYQQGAGSSWTLMSEGAYAFGISGRELTLNAPDIFALLEQGTPIICSMNPGDFTDSGHYIVMTGVEDGKIRVNDPNSKKRSGELWDFEQLQWQIGNLWAFERVS